MILKSLSLKNIGRYKDEFITFDNNQLSLIVGKNGAGKSTIFDSILWSIFGKTSKETSIDEIVQLGEEQGTVILTLQDGEHTYTIQRIRNVKKQTTLLEFAVDDIYMSKATLASTESTIQQYLKTDFITFRNSIFFGQDEVNQFVNGTDKERKDVLTRFLNLEICDKALVKIKEIKNKLLSEISVWKENKIQMESSHANLSSSIKIIEEANKRLEDHKRQKEVALTESKVTVENATKKYNEVKQQYDILQALRSHRDKINSFYESIRQKQLTIQSYRQQLEQVDTRSSCPTCGQDMDVEIKKQTRKQIVQAGNAIVREIEATFKEINLPEVSKLEDLANVLRELNIQLEKENELQNELVQWQMTIAKNNPKDIGECFDYRIQSEESLIQSHQRTIQGYNNFLAHIEEYDNKIKVAEEKIEKLLKLEDIFGTNGLKTAIIENVINTLEDKINTVIAHLTAGITVSLETQVQGKTGKIKEKFSIYVYDTNGKREFRTYSGGEKRIISVAIRFAFAQLALERSNSLLKFLLLDEVTDAFDDRRKETFFTLLEQLQNDYDQIFVISHDNIFKDMFSNIIEIIKDSAGISHIRRDQ